MPLWILIRVIESFLVVAERLQKLFLRSMFYEKWLNSYLLSISSFAFFFQNLFQSNLNQLWNTFVLYNLTKGQIISKELFGILNSPKNQTKTIRLYYNDTSGRLVFVRFLEEIEGIKKPFRNYLIFKENHTWRIFNFIWNIAFTHESVTWRLSCCFPLFTWPIKPFWTCAIFWYEGC